jgi:hypothetical protein
MNTEPLKFELEDNERNLINTESKINIWDIFEYEMKPILKKNVEYVECIKKTEKDLAAFKDLTNIRFDRLHQEMLNY